jgi:hypothetical protein
MKHLKSTFIVATALVGLAAGMGCQGLKNGDMKMVQTTSSDQRAGNVYLVRGLIGVFSTGMDTLGDQLTEAGLRTNVYQDAQRDALAAQLVETYKGKKDYEPLVLVGHSYGADDVVTIARRLDEAGIAVDLLVTIDATTPPRVSKNVKLCYNYFQSTSTDFIPMFRGIPLTPDDDAKNVKIVNIDLRKDRKDLLEPDTNHINIDKNMKLHKVLVDHVLEVCPTRAVWAAQHGGAMPATQPTYGARANPVRNAADTRLN